MRFRITLIAVLSLLWIAGAQRIAHAENDILRDRILSTLPTNAAVIAYLPCPILGPVADVVCVVTQKREESKSGEPSRLLRMYEVKEETGVLNQVFQFDADNALDSISMINHTTLLAIWTTGSGYRYTIFRRAGKAGIKLVLDSGGRTYPEFADLEDDGVPEVLVTDWIYDPSKRKGELIPTKTSVYRFMKDGYKRVRTVPWKERFQVPRQG
jgi:hypothetical protein